MKIDVREQIKLLANHRKLYLKDLALLLSEKTGKKYSLASLSAKLVRGTLTYNEVLTICEILDYEITFTDKRTK